MSRDNRSGAPWRRYLPAAVAAAAVLLVAVNILLGKHHTTPPSNEPEDGQATQQTNQTTPQTPPVQKPEPEEEIVHTVIELQGDEQQYDAVYRVGDTGFEMYSYVDGTAKKYADNVNAVADALAGTAKVYMLPIPLSSGITLPDKLYGKEVFADQKAAEQKIIGYMNANVISVPLYDTMMAHRGEYIYFRTDHHWTATGAYYAYDALMKTMGKTAKPLDGYTTEEFDGFLGTFYRDSAENATMGANPDTVVAYHPRAAEATLDYTDKDGQTVRWDIIYDESDAPASYKYGTFIGGDQPYVVIKNPALTDGSACVVVKESFGNAFVPFLVDHYQTVHVLDYRYWDGSISQFVKDCGAKDVLFVNNLSAIRSSVLVGYLHDIL